MTPVDRRTVIGTALGAAAMLPAVSRAARASHPQPDFSVNLWPGEAPGLTDPSLKDEVLERSKDPAVLDRAMVRIRTPRMDVFLPKSSNGAAVMITPGGAYQRVVMDKEGYELAAWLAARGIAAFVCFYRLPGQGWENPRDVALADAQRAMRLIRHRAVEYALDPNRVAALGYSAGGHVCGDLATRHAEKVYAPVDAADTLDARPIIAAPMYPAIAMDPFLGKQTGTTLGTTTQVPATGPGWQMLDAQVSKTTPPTFLCHAEDDPVLPIANTLRLREALKAAGVPVETHLFEEGGHGFGLRFTVGKPVAIWPELLLAFGRRHRWLLSEPGIPHPATPNG